MGEIEGKELRALRYLQSQKDTISELKAALSSSEKENAELQRQVELLQKKGRKKLPPQKLSPPRANEPSSSD